jgi:hypothetical protein
VVNTFNWKCPFCFNPQIVTESNSHVGFRPLLIDKNKYGPIGLRYEAISCLNMECQEVYLSVDFSERISNPNGGSYPGNVIQTYMLRPDSVAKIFPEFIPAVLRQDYVEACRIKSLSPKASATLSRRCLQGAIRDFCKVSGQTLDAEIRELTKLLQSGQAPLGVTPESLEAIDHVRRIGNIGAHMEKDINLIIEIDEGEAQSLIDLIELLFEEWYEARERRRERLARVKEIRSERRTRRMTSRISAILGRLSRRPLAELCFPSLQPCQGRAFLATAGFAPCRSRDWQVATGLQSRHI